jgi:hypothetical protein
MVAMRCCACLLVLAFACSTLAAPVSHGVAQQRIDATLQKPKVRRALCICGIAA